jgi:hypothetical protein
LPIPWPLRVPYQQAHSLRRFSLNHPVIVNPAKPPLA